MGGHRGLRGGGRGQGGKGSTGLKDQEAGAHACCLTGRMGNLPTHEGVSNGENGGGGATPPWHR